MSLAALDLDLERYHESEADGHTLRAGAVEGQVAALAALSPEERKELAPLNPKRAPFILAGAVILDEILRRYALDEIETSERDLLDGAALEAARAAGSRRRRGPARRLRLLLIVDRALVLGQPPLQDGAAQDADEASSVDHRDALGVVLLEEPEGRLPGPRTSRSCSAAPRRSRPAASRVDAARERRPRAPASSASPLRTAFPSSSQTKTARTSGRASRTPASCALASAASQGGSGTIASLTRLTDRCRARSARRRPRGSRRPARRCAGSCPARRPGARRGRRRRSSSRAV